MKKLSVWFTLLAGLFLLSTSYAITVKYYVWVDNLPKHYFREHRNDPFDARHSKLDVHLWSFLHTEYHHRYYRLTKNTSGYTKVKFLHFQHTGAFSFGINNLNGFCRVKLWGKSIPKRGTITVKAHYSSHIYSHTHKGDLYDIKLRLHVSTKDRHGKYHSDTKECSFDTVDQHVALL